MSRLKVLRKYINSELNQMKDEDERDAAFVHLYGVSLATVILAKKRGLDEELAAIAAMLHDLDPNEYAGVEVNGVEIWK